MRFDAKAAEQLKRRPDASAKAGRVARRSHAPRRWRRPRSCSQGTKPAC